MSRSRAKKKPARSHVFYADSSIPPDHKGNRRCRRCGVMGSPGDVRHTEEFPPVPPEDRSNEMTGEH